MKKFITKYAAYIIIAAMVAALIPGIINRVGNENKNDNITISVLYNDMIQKVSEDGLDQILEEYKGIGVNTISIMEEDINALVARGDVTSIKYNILRHKYDDESMNLADMIAEKCPDITYDSHVVIASRDEAKEMLAYMLPRRYSEKEYADIGVFDDLYIYVLYDGRKALYDYAIGYNEKVIDKFVNNGFNVALIHKVKNYPNLEYQEDIDRIVKKYNIEYLNLKKDNVQYKESEIKKENYEGIAEIINANDMTLVLTENTDQLSNQKFLGYSYIFNKVMGQGGTNKVVRAFETYDDSQSDETYYKHRVEQYLNSTVDRNTRFVTVTQIVPEKIPYEDCAEYTLKAVAEYKQKAEGLGFRINSDVNRVEYTSNRKFNAALSAVIIIMCLLLMYEMASGKKNFAVTMAAIGLSILAFAGTFIVPESLILLYPTVFCAVQSCMAMTSVLYFIKTQKDKIHFAFLMLGTLGIMLFVLFAGSVGMGAMLSGIDYYINNLIFRGIKVSLIVPIFYTAVLYYFMFVKDSETSVINDIKKVFNLEIKVYWVLLAGVVLVIGFYYILRSGNVSSISSIEQAMRSAVTELFTARPRTKEFLIGYPALVLFVYYMKHSNIQLIKWLLAVAASILAASITNSFCHVFTDYSVIVNRTINGLILGIGVSVAAYIANIVLIKVLKVLKSKLGI